MTATAALDVAAEMGEGSLEAVAAVAKGDGQTHAAKEDEPLARVRATCKGELCATTSAEESCGTVKENATSRAE